MILDTTLEPSKVLKGLREEGWSMTRGELAMLSPYQTQHSKRFGNHVPDLETLPQPIDEDPPFPSHVRAPSELLRNREKLRARVQIVFIPPMPLPGSSLLIASSFLRFHMRFWYLASEEQRNGKVR